MLFDTLENRRTSDMLTVALLSLHGFKGVTAGDKSPKFPERFRRRFPRGGSFFCAEPRD